MKYIILTLFLTSSTLLANIGKISAIHGKATLNRGNQTQIIHAGTTLEKHDSIHTQKGSKLQIVFNDKTVISLGQNSDFRVDEYIFDDKNVQASFSVTKGFFKSMTGKIGKIAPSHFHVKTANATIGVRGTTIIGEVSSKLDIIACTYGRIVVTTPQGSVIVNKGERTIVKQNRSPRQAKKVNPVILKKLDQQSDVNTIPTPAPKPTVTQKTTKPTSTKKVIKKETETLTQQKQSIKEKETIDKKEQTQPEQTQPEKNIHSLQDIQNIIGTQTPAYQGKITQGTTSYGNIKEDNSNDVRLGFDLGEGSMQGDLKFQDNIQQYDIKVGGKVHDDASFDFNSQNGYNGQGSGKLEGEGLKNANGSFDFSENDLHTNTVINHIQGNFETKR